MGACRQCFADSLYKLLHLSNIRNVQVVKSALASPLKQCKFSEKCEKSVQKPLGHQSSERRSLCKLGDECLWNLKVETCPGWWLAIADTELFTRKVYYYKGNKYVFAFLCCPIYQWVQSLSLIFQLFAFHSQGLFVDLPFQNNLLPLNMVWKNKQTNKPKLYHLYIIIKKIQDIKHSLTFYTALALCCSSMSWMLQSLVGYQ